MSFLFGHKNLIMFGIGLILVTLLAGYIQVLRERVETLDLQNMTLRSSLEISNLSIANLNKSIDEQNASIEKLKTSADERTLRYLDEIDAAKKVANGYKAQASDLLRRTSKQNVSKCDAANQLINEEIANAK